jgi:hypothetical protein
VAKRFGPFDVLKVPESQKTCKNKQIYFIVLKPNERGLFKKPLIDVKHAQVLIKLSNN